MILRGMDLLHSAYVKTILTGTELQSVYGKMILTGRGH
jgi:hypothetical protein